jgi:LysM repeat protein
MDRPPVPCPGGPLPWNDGAPLRRARLAFTGSDVYLSRRTSGVGSVPGVASFGPQFAPPPPPAAPRMMRRRSRHPLAPTSLILAGAVVAAGWSPFGAEAQTLRGGTASLDRQNHQADAHDFTRLRTPDEVRRFVGSGYLVPVVANRDFDVHNVSFPYARPEVNLFIQRLAAQYRAACGEKLVVTSLTRPLSNQPWNASSRSVHPTGMAVDLRRSSRAACRNWLERTLLALEAEGLLEAIYERNPPHYHVAVYPRPYATYVARITGNNAVMAQTASEDVQVEQDWVTHRVRRGETLSGIGDRYGVPISRIRAENGIRGSRILVGQELRVPVYRTVAVTAAAEPAPAGESAPQEPTARESTAQGPAAQEATARSLPRTVAGEATVGGEMALAEGAGGQGDGAPAGGGDAAGYGGGDPALDGDGDVGLDGGGDPPPTRDEAVSRTATAEPVVHRVGRGESLWTIARMYGVSEGELRSANGIRGSRILAGQELRVPVETGYTAAVVRHTVRNGESLWIIARRHGVTVEDLRRTNRIGSSRIHPGQVLDVPVSR